MSFELKLRKKFSDVPPDADLTSYEFALALDKRDQLSFLRDEFHYPKMKDLPISKQYFASQTFKKLRFKKIESDFPYCSRAVLCES